MIYNIWFITYDELVLDNIFYMLINIYKEGKMLSI